MRSVYVAQVPPLCGLPICIIGKSCQHYPAATYALTNQIDLLFTSAYRLSILLSHKSMTMFCHHYES